MFWYDVKKVMSLETWYERWASPIKWKFVFSLILAILMLLMVVSKLNFKHKYYFDGWFIFKILFLTEKIKLNQTKLFFYVYVKKYSILFSQYLFSICIHLLIINLFVYLLFYNQNNCWNCFSICMCFATTHNLYVYTTKLRYI